MPSRIVLFLVCLCLVASACKNEPYQYPPLGITAFINHAAATTKSFRYRDQKIYSFLWMGSDTISYIRFHYGGTEVQNLVTDSTSTSMKLTSFYRDGNTVADTTLMKRGDASEFIGARSITYNDDGKPVIVYMKTINVGQTTEGITELTWENGNVVRQVRYKIAGGEKTLEEDLVIGHDDQNCIYTTNMNYVFTLQLDNLYWLSKNNPRTFNVGKGDVKFTYWYNKFGYPTNVKTDGGALFGLTYTQIR